jgi:hypothetical protein
VDRELDALEARLTDVYREIETDARLKAGRSEARYLKIVVVLLLAVLGVVLLAVVLGVL